jgi:hypothetical protein
MGSRFFYSFLIIFLFFSCNKDVENVKLFGYVYDKNENLPLENVKLKIENAYDEGGDFDSYNHYENFIITTDKKGYYSITFKKSAYIQVEALIEGYERDFKSLLVR